MTSAAEKHDPYELLRQRDFRLYLIGRLVAIIGQQMFAMAVGWEIYERTGSALALGMVGLTQVVPMFLFTLPAGHVADNHNRKHVVLLMTGIVATANLVLAFVSAVHAPIGFTFGLLFVMASARTFLAASAASFLPQLVERRLLSQAINWSASVFQTASIVGPVVAGFIIGHLHHAGVRYPAAPIYALNALAALTFCAFLARVRHLHVEVVKEKFSIATLLNGFRFVFSTRIILGVITLDMFAVFLGGATSLLPVFAKDVLHAGADGLGLLQAALPLGSVLCALHLAHRPPMQKAGRALLWCVVIFGLATMGFGLCNNYALGKWLGWALPDQVWFWFAFAMLFVCGAADNVSVVVRHTSVQLLTPDDKRGRVSSVNSLFIGTSNELGGFESGFVAHLAGPAMGNAITTGAIISVVTGGLGTILVVAAVAALWPEIRKYGKMA